MISMVRASYKSIQESLNSCLFFPSWISLYQAEESKIVPLTFALCSELGLLLFCKEGITATTHGKVSLTSIREGLLPVSPLSTPPVYKIAEIGFEIWKATQNIAP